MSHVDVSALLVVIPRVVGSARHGGPLLGVGPHEVDVWEGLDLCLLQRAELGAVQPQSLVGGEGAAHLQAAPSTAHSELASGFTGTLTGLGAVDTSDVMNKQVSFSMNHWIYVEVKHAPVSPVYAALPGQAGNLDRLRGRLSRGPAVLRSCCGYGADLSVVGGVLVQVFHLQLATSHGHLIPEDCLVANNLLEKGQRERERKRMKGNSRSDSTPSRTSQTWRTSSTFLFARRLSVRNQYIRVKKRKNVWVPLLQQTKET